MENITIQLDSISMIKASGYGHYFITLKGAFDFEEMEDLRILTTDSETYDWYNDDSNQEKHLIANDNMLRSILRSYNNEYNVIFE
jgi:hypothetical protein